jgi:hypothetical protein
VKNNISWNNEAAYGGDQMQEVIRADKSLLQVHFLPPSQIFERATRLADGGAKTQNGSSTCIVISETNALKKAALEAGCYFYNLSEAFGPQSVLVATQFLEANKTDFTEIGFRYIAHAVWADLFATSED